MYLYNVVKRSIYTNFYRIIYNNRYLIVHYLLSIVFESMSLFFVSGVDTAKTCIFKQNLIDIFKSKLRKRRINQKFTN